MHPRCVSLNRRPELARLNVLVPRGEATRVEEHLDDRLEPLRGRELVAGLPLLDGTQTHPGSLGKLSLDKACPSAMAQ